MGTELKAVVQHHLTSVEILSLDGLVVDPIFDGRTPAPLKWEPPTITADFLVEFWSKISDHYTTNPWAEVDIPMLRNEEIDIFPWMPHLLDISTFFRPSLYKSHEPFRLKFNNAVATIAKAVNASDVIIIEDWYVYHAFDEHIGLTVAEIKKGVAAKNLPYFEIDF